MPRRLFLTFLGAILATLVFPPFNVSLLAPLAWIPLFLALQNTNLRTSFRLGVLHGLICYAATLCWMFTIFKTLAPALWLMLALFTGIFGMAFHFTHRFNVKGRPLILATVWTGIEYYRCELFFLDFPWITPGTGFPPNFFTPLVGVYGVSFLLIFSGLVLLTRLQERPKNSWPLPAAMFAAFWFLAGFVQVGPNKADLSVALIQNEEALLDLHLEMSEPHAGKVDAIVWPEYAIRFDPTTHPRGRDIQTLLQDKTEVLVLGGTQDHQDSFYNTAFTVGKSGPLGTHVKNHPVHLFADGIAGTKAEPVETPLGKVGTPICFDCDYQDVIRRMTFNGAEFFFIPSMDAQSWTERQHLQHAQLFRHRAAENGRWLAVAATSGQTQIISPWGHQVETLPLMDDGVLTGNIAPLGKLTLFTRGGWLIGPICLALTGILFLAFLASLYRQKKAPLPESLPSKNSSRPQTP